MAVMAQHSLYYKHAGPGLSRRVSPKCALTFENWWLHSVGFYCFVVSKVIGVKKHDYCWRAADVSLSLCACDSVR